MRSFFILIEFKGVIIIITTDSKHSLVIEMEGNKFPSDEKSYMRDEQQPQPQLPFKIRKMPIMAGEFLFSSVESSERYRKYDYKKTELHPDGIGIPLFHFKHHNFKKWDRSVEKYILQDVRDPPPEPPYRIKKQDGNLVLYKVEHCKIYLRSCGNWDIEYTRSFRHIKKYDLISFPWTREGFIGSVNGFDLPWRTINSHEWGDHELLANYDDISQLINGGLSSFSEKEDEEHIDGPLLPQGLYRRNIRDPKVTNRYHSLFFLEKTDSLDLGIRHVSPVTEFLSLHGMLLHYAVVGIIAAEEARKANQRAQATNMAVGSNMFMMGAIAGANC